MKKIETLLKRIIDEADEKHDGHFTIMKFTTGYKVLFETPSMSERDRRDVQSLPLLMDLAESLKVADCQKREFTGY